MLISRSPYKLQNVAAEIGLNFCDFFVELCLISHVLYAGSTYKVKTRIIDVDFTNGLEIYERIGKEIEGLQIGVLINNVGMSYNYPEYLAQVNPNRNLQPYLSIIITNKDAREIVCC